MFFNLKMTTLNKTELRKLLICEEYDKLTDLTFNDDMIDLMMEYDDVNLMRLFVEKGIELDLNILIKCVETSSINCFMYYIENSKIFFKYDVDMAIHKSIYKNREKMFFALVEKFDYTFSFSDFESTIENDTIMKFILDNTQFDNVDSYYLDKVLNSHINKNNIENVKLLIENGFELNNLSYQYINSLEMLKFLFKYYSPQSSYEYEKKILILKNYQKKSNTVHKYKHHHKWIKIEKMIEHFTKINNVDCLTYMKHNNLWVDLKTIDIDFLINETNFEAFDFLVENGIDSNTILNSSYKKGNKKFYRKYTNETSYKNQLLSSAKLSPSDDGVKYLFSIFDYDITLAYLLNVKNDKSFHYLLNKYNGPTDDENLSLDVCQNLYRLRLIVDEGFPLNKKCYSKSIYFSEHVESHQEALFDVLKFLFKHNCPKDEDLCLTLTKYGFYEMLVWAHERGFEWNTDLYHTISDVQHEGTCEWEEFEKCVLYAYENGCPFPE